MPHTFWASLGYGWGLENNTDRNLLPVELNWSCGVNLCVSSPLSRRVLEHSGGGVKAVICGPGPNYKKFKTSCQSLLVDFIRKLCLYRPFMNFDRYNLKIWGTLCSALTKISSQVKKVFTSCLLTSLFAGAPWEAVCDVVESVKDVKEGPCHNDDVVNILQEHHHQGRVTNSLKRNWRKVRTVGT